MSEAFQDLQDYCCGKRLIKKMQEGEVSRTILKHMLHIEKCMWTLSTEVRHAKQVIEQHLASKVDKRRNHLLSYIVAALEPSNNNWHSL